MSYRSDLWQDDGYEVNLDARVSIGRSRLGKVRVGGRVFGSQAKRLNRVHRESDRGDWTESEKKIK